MASCKGAYRRGHTANDVSRLREAGIQQVEARAKVQLAEAEKKIAEAAKYHAEAEKIQAETQVQWAAAEAISMDAQARSVSTKAEAFEKVMNAISKIRQEGGDVAFDKEELKQLLKMPESSKTEEPAQLEMDE